MSEILEKLNGPYTYSPLEGVEILARLPLKSKTEFMKLGDKSYEIWVIAKKR